MDAFLYYELGLAGVAAAVGLYWRHKHRRAKESDERERIYRLCAQMPERPSALSDPSILLKKPNNKTT